MEGVPPLIWLGLAAAAVVLGTFAWLSRRLVPRALPYYSQETLCSRGELAFFRVLVVSLPKGVAVALKTRLSDVIGCTGEGWKAGYGAKISQKHVDFVLFDLATTAILLVIELDDKTHDQPTRQTRDAFMDEALRTAGVPILRVVASREYDPKLVREEIARRLRYPAAA